MRIAIIGAGPAGLAAAWELIKAGHQCVIYESADRPGGLAAGFKEEGWTWELEKFYHHWFQTDHDILGLIEELSWRDQVIFPRPKTSMWAKGKAYLFDNPLSMLLYPHLEVIPKLRFGLIGLYLRLAKNWQGMEKYTAEEWLIRTMGKRAYEVLWRPMLIGKFGDVYREVTMAWFWARVHTRTTQLGTFTGGFQRFLDQFAVRLEEKGTKFQYQVSVQQIQSKNGKVHISAGGITATFDAAISTASPGALLKLAPEIDSLDPQYGAKLRALRHMGAAVVILALKQQLMSDGTYWLNLPAASPDKSQSEFPFVALVEHTNYLPREHYGGDHIVYCGEYVMPDHPYLSMSEDALSDLFISALKRVNPAFDPGWIRKRWVFRTPYAQPIPLVNHSGRIPDLRTPIPGLYSANMSQVYPWDRGTNYAVMIGKQAAARLIQEVKV